MSIVLVDIDHTLSDARPRDWILDQKPIDWDAYHSASIADKTVTPIVNLVNGMYDTGYVTFAVTGRPEKWRHITMEWLTVYGVKINKLLMRPDRDFRPVPVVKSDLIADYVDQVSFALDDNERVIEMYRAIGIFAVQVVL